MCIRVKYYYDQPSLKAFKILSWTIDPQTKRPIIISPIARTQLTPYKKLKAFHARSRKCQKLDTQIQYANFDKGGWGWSAFIEAGPLNISKLEKTFRNAWFIDKGFFRPAIGLVTLYGSKDHPIAIGEWGLEFRSAQAHYMRLDKFIRGAPISDIQTPITQFSMLGETIQKARKMWGYNLQGAIHPNL